MTLPEAIQWCESQGQKIAVTKSNKEFDDLMEELNKPSVQAGENIISSKFTI